MPFNRYLELIELFPSLSRNTSAEEEIRDRAVCKLLGLRIELKFCIKFLSDDSEAKYLAERTGDAEWRTCLLESLTCKEEVCKVI